MLETKVCYTCKEDKPTADFGILRRQSDGLNPNCKSCKRQIEKDYFHNNEHARKKRAVDNRRYKYGISVEQYNNFFIVQNYSCAICNIHLDEQTYTTTPRVDHCHETGKVRGLLCGQCNVGIGHFYENESFLLSAVEYLRKHK